ncbi:MAG: DUF4405 domain-containing protein, partial [Chloroflexi bacterium]|nr:DUF4405 domain-containing protein [Chloroflexota bacterium]
MAPGDSALRLKYYRCPDDSHLPNGLIRLALTRPTTRELPCAVPISSAQERTGRICCPQTDTMSLHSLHNRYIFDAYSMGSSSDRINRIRRPACPRCRREEGEGMSSKAKLNFGVDVTIAAAFALSALSGIVLLLVPGGYQGGRNALYGTQVLLSHSAWSALHTWASLVMIAGVLLHVALHWDWIV